MLERISLGRKNLVGMWETAAFKWPFAYSRMLGRELMICNDPESVKFAFSTHNDSFERKSREMRQMLKPLIGDGLFISDGETWRRRRRLISPILHLSRMPQFAPIMVEAALETRARWAKQPPDEAIDVLKEMGQLTAEIICRTIFGRTLGRQYSRQIVEGFAQYQKAVDVFHPCAALGLPEWFSRRSGPKIRAAVAQIDAVLDEVFGQIKAAGPGDETSLVGQLMLPGEHGPALDEHEARNEASVLFMAGYETSANALAWAWYLLANDDMVRARLDEELDEVLGGRLPAIDDVPRLVWTRAVIEETLRLYPPVALLSREAVRGETLKGVALRKGATILVVPWLLHRHKKLWSKPDLFRPQRFLPDATSGPVSKFAYVPFSIGPRVCPGQSFALVETILGVATLAQSFRLEVDPGHTVEPICHMTLRPGDALPMRVVPRHAGCRPGAVAGDG